MMEKRYAQMSASEVANEFESKHEKEHYEFDSDNAVHEPKKERSRKEIIDRRKQSNREGNMRVEAAAEKQRRAEEAKRRIADKLERVRQFFINYCQPLLPVFTHNAKVRDSWEDETESIDTCLICLEDMDSGDCQLPCCTRKWHGDCIKQLPIPQCPTCKVKFIVPGNNIVYLILCEDVFACSINVLEGGKYEYCVKMR